MARSMVVCKWEVVAGFIEKMVEGGWVASKGSPRLDEKQHAWLGLGRVMVAWEKLNGGAQMSGLEKKRK